MCARATSFGTAPVSQLLRQNLRRGLKALSDELGAVALCAAPLLLRNRGLFSCTGRGCPVEILAGLRRLANAATRYGP
jgi:hypothetical protein